MTRRWLDHARRWLAAARSFARHAYRVATGRSALHVIDRAGNTRMILDTRRERWAVHFKQEPR